MFRTRLGSSVAVLAASVGFAGACRADVMVNATMTVDNLFTAYISTDDTVAGSQFLSGANWPDTFQGSATISAPGTYYLHIAAVDQGPPAMFIGLFTLAGTGATFSNGTQQLLTGVSDWQVSPTGFGGASTAPVDIGPNGSGPWGNFPLMGAAHYVWAPNSPLTAFFSATITVTPAPQGAGVLVLAGVLGAARRRRR